MDNQKLHQTNQVTHGIYEDVLDELERVLESIGDLQAKHSSSAQSDSPDLEVSREGNTLRVERLSAEMPDLSIERVPTPEPQAKKTSQLFAESETSVAIPDLSIERLPTPPSQAKKTSLPLAESASDEENTPDKRPAPDLLYSAKTGKLVTDLLTKEDAKAVAAMLSGKAGDNIPNAANLRITINGKVVAEADAYGNLIATNTSEQSLGLSQHFSTLATEDKRPSKLDGIEKMTEIASLNPHADGHQFMQQLVNNFAALHSPDMPQVTGREGLTKPTLANATAIMNLYATKALEEDSYKLKEGGTITARPGTEDLRDFQFFEVRDAAGNIDMGFTVCPNGMILLDPKISSTLQAQISQMEQAWNQGLYNDDTPLMTADKARADAVFSFQQNVTSPSITTKSDLPLDIKTDQRGNVTATSKANPQAKIQLNKTKDGGFRILGNSLATSDLLEFNKAFASQTNSQSAKESEASKPKTKKVAPKAKRQQLSM